MVVSFIPRVNAGGSRIISVEAHTRLTFMRCMQRRDKILALRLGKPEPFHTHAKKILNRMREKRKGREGFEGASLFSDRSLGLMRAIGFRPEKFYFLLLCFFVCFPCELRKDSLDHLHVHLQDHLYAHLHVFLISIANHRMQISMPTDKACMHPPLTHSLTLFRFKI
jgi:hypothetical protein